MLENFRPGKPRLSGRGVGFYFNNQLTNGKQLLPMFLRQLCLPCLVKK